MAQEYLPAVREGDKRIILIEGEAAGAVLRVPAEDEARANLHVGARAVHAELTDRDREICARIGPRLRDKGVIFAGIDVVGEHLTEINITSPTGVPGSATTARPVPSTSQTTAVAEAKSGSGETEGEARTPSSADDARGFVVAVVLDRG